jgi:hypothetical protein
MATEKKVTKQEPWLSNRNKKPTETKTTGSTTLGPSQEAENEVANVPGGTGATGKKGLTGVPIGTTILKGYETLPGPEGARMGPKPIYGKTQYAPGSGATTFASLGNKEKVALLIRLSSIPNLYGRGKAYTPERLQAVASSGTIPVREEDFQALEKVMALADTTGDDYLTTLTYLETNPQVAIATFGEPKGKKLSLTPADALALEYEQSVLDYLDIKVSKADKNAYAKAVNEAERKRGGSLTSLERQQILIDSIQDKAREVFKDDKFEDSDLMRRGALGETFAAINQTYRDYGVTPPDTNSVYKQAINSIRSKQALDNTINKIRLASEVSMPAIKTYLQQGLSAREALGSYIGIYSKIYGVPENQVDLSKVSIVASGDKIMPTQDYLKYLYAQPDIVNSPYYKQQELNDARALVSNFIG